MSKHSKAYYSFAIIAILITAIALYLMGRLPWCSCGYIKFWNTLVENSGNSQHLFDWFSFSHVLHGMGVYFLIWLVDRKKQLSIAQKFLLATVTECSWEILENSSFIIDRYRAATVSFNYTGDSIINSLGDIFSMTIGFLIALKSKPWISLIIFIFIELALLYAIRDNLTLNILMLVFPFDSIKQWQAVGGPFTR